ncbi:MAG: tyrosine recombinase [Planctomycetota bacterium]|nr:tyrosine recombinase [Planctomycetota bacterium]
MTSGSPRSRRRPRPAPSNKPKPAQDEALPPDLDLAKREFLSAMRVEAGLSARTLEAYGRDLQRGLGWLARAGLKRLAALQQEAVLDYLKHRRDKGMSEATLARELVSLRMLLRYAQSEGWIEQSPIALMPAPKRQSLLPNVLSPEEVERLLEAPDPTQWRGQRDKALLEIIYATGARVSEAVSLTTDSLQPELTSLRLHGKGDKTRIVPLGGPARQALTTWLEQGRKKQLAGRQSPHVFIGRTQKPLTRGTAWRIVRAAALTAGLTNHLSPHTLRHSFATHMIESGGDLRSVQEMLGHASIRTTEVYTHLDSEHVRSIHRLYHPRG